MRVICITLMVAVSAGMIIESGLFASSTTGQANLSELVKNSAQIAEIQVLDKHSVLLPDGSIETRLSLATVTPMKGAIPSIQTVRMPGGAVAGRGLYIPGMPTFEIGDQSIVFLSEEGKSKPWRIPVGFKAGVYQVRPAAQGKVVVGTTAAAQPHAQNYDEFVRQVLDEVQRQR